MTAPENGVDAVVQQLGSDTVSSLQQRFELAYLTVWMPCPGAFTRACGSMRTSSRWKGETSEKKGLKEPVEGCASNTSKCTPITRRSHGSGSSRTHQS